jgi:RluA family pseudouridine synthase
MRTTICWSSTSRRAGTPTRPAIHAGEGIYDWLKHREPRWFRLAIVHRLDKDTSGLIVFGKTPEANRSLTGQFTKRQVRKQYTMVTDRPVHRETFTVQSEIVRDGDRYLARPLTDEGDCAETRFRVARREGGHTWIEAEPVTGRTHQIRVHAAAEGLPILGDRLYAGSAASRLQLHATALEFQHPRSGDTVRLTAQPDFVTPVPRQLRAAVIDPTRTNTFREIHGAADGKPGSYQERLGAWLLLESEEVPVARRCRVPVQDAAGSQRVLQAAVA